MVFTFWFAFFMVFYAYFGYPFSLFFLSFFYKREKKEARSYASQRVSFIITAFNEEARISEKIKNSLEQDYPDEYYEIIVASDCSEDKTDDIVRLFSDQGVKLVRAPERKGKENAQKHAIEQSSGDVLVFSDVATVLQPDGISKIVNNFKDLSVGCVSSEDRFIDSDGKVSGEGLYVRYEMFLRNLESRVNTLVGLSGSFFAARRTVCENWEVDLQSDFNTLLNSIKKGMRGITDQNSLGFYKNISDERKEYDRKVRTILRGISVLMANLSLLNPFKYGLFAWQLFSHKLCRWLVPFFLIIILFLNILLLGEPLYWIILFFQGLGYFSAYYYYKTAISQRKQHESITENKLLKICFFFVIVNISILSAWFKYFRGERTTFWSPSKR